jgi:HK97 family phage portal protein
MWPFSTKISANTPSVAAQVSFALKSITLPESQPTWNLFPQSRREWSTTTAIDEGYNASAIVYAAVEKRAKLIASVPWYAGIKNADGDVERLPDSHPLNVLINRPNPDQSWYELIYSASQMLDLSGSAFMPEIKGGARKQPISISVLNSEYIKIKAGRERLVDMYQYINGNITRNIEPDDMVQLKLPNPKNPYFGQPVLMAAGRAADIDREAGNWQKASLQNRNISDIHVEVPEGTQPDQVAAISKALKERGQSPDNARSPLVTSGKINQLSRTAVEMDFTASRRSVWTELAAVFGTPLGTLGFTEDLNLANAEAMMKQLWQETIVPQLTLLKYQFDHQLASEFGPNIVMMYDLSNITALQESLDSKLANAERLYRLGISLKAINGRLELGFDDEDMPDETEPDENEPIDTEEVKRLLKSVTYGGDE